MKQRLYFLSIEPLFLSVNGVSISFVLTNIKLHCFETKFILE
ncbi:hypothetical protein HMPREF2532_01020 [Bacteroides ovatus]|nr:hypothetical protein HMPREF2532_01020 [Bacteroides ovatus]